MIGDKYRFEEHQKNKALNAVKELLLAKKKNIFSVAIGGISGTSKSEIAIIIRELLHDRGFKSFILHFDDYYETSWHSRNEIRKKTNIIGKEEINWNKINKILHDFKRNHKKLYVQEIDIYLDKIIHHIIPCRNVVEILILEGLYACYANVDFKIYLDANNSDTYEFRKNRGKENPDNKFRQLVIERESNCVRQSKKLADLIIPFKYKEK